MQQGFVAILFVAAALALALAIFAAVWAVVTQRKGSSKGRTCARRGGRGCRGATGRVGPTGAPLNVSYLGFTVNDGSVLASTAGPVGSFMTYGTLGNIGLDPTSVRIAGDFISILATHTGFLQNLHVYVNPGDEQSTSPAAGSGVATIWKTDPCGTGFSPTPLSASWPVPAGLDAGTHCAFNTTDRVLIAPLDRFMLVFTAAGPTGVSYEAPASAGLEYAFA